MFRSLLSRFWNDECGAVIATEYLMLGSVVAVGSASGMVAMRDTIVDEYKELGASVREIRQTHVKPLKPAVAMQPTVANPVTSAPLFAMP
jgi:Flp pilus assembly pilin Flp